MNRHPQGKHSRAKLASFPTKREHKAVIRALGIVRWLLGGLLASTCLAQNGADTNCLQIRSVLVEGKPQAWPKGQTLDLKPNPKWIVFNFGAITNAARQPIRLSYQLEGYEREWHEGGGDMYFALRFLDTNNDLIDIQTFRVAGNSAGWNGSLNRVPLSHRRELLTVPPRAARLQAVLSSAGPPSTVGIYIMDGLVISRLASTNGPAAVLLRSPLDHMENLEDTNQVPSGWIRDGTRPSMAKIVELGRDSAAKAFAIMDDDGLSHAEWRNLNEIAPQVRPGEMIVAEWNEAYSIGVNDAASATYPALPSGEYQFRVAESTALGAHTGVEATLRLRVALPFWKTPWFWGLVVAAISALSVALGRYVTWLRMRRELARLHQQRLIEQERLRIARNIHDDLGARVTQISLLSGLAQDNSGFPEKARSEFDRISRMSRDLVSALYETVWTVNPENDNLDALGNYLCQMANQLCDQARLRCRIKMGDLPGGLQLSSSVRHNFTLAAKEAIHNVIKHARATEVALRVEFASSLLVVEIQDNGAGFAVDTAQPGNGLANMQRRLADLGGSCTVYSQPGQGATVRLELKLLI